MPAFDPNSAPSVDSGVFGLPHRLEDSALVLLPVPWEATTSYGGGTSKGPAAILNASAQIDLFDGQVLRPYEPGIFMLPESAEIRRLNKTARAAAAKIIAVGGDIGADKRLARDLATVNRLGAELNDWVRRETLRQYDAGKIVGIVGGDHSVPYGAFSAAASAHGRYGLLHFDAHSDTRDAYEGFVWSHASIMRNALNDIPEIEKIVQVGIRDYCEQEDAFIRTQGNRASVFFDRDLSSRRFSGTTWDEIAIDIVEKLPRKVWVTFDIDGFDPKLCPNTGTPVPGGLEFNEANRILELLALSGREIIGFDLVEVAPDPANRNEWDANVGMRFLYKLAAWTFVSRGLRRAQTSPLPPKSSRRSGLSPSR